MLWPGTASMSCEEMELAMKTKKWIAGICTLAAAVLACLRRYRAVPQPHRAGIWAPRVMGEIPLELEPHLCGRRPPAYCAGGGPFLVPLG